MLVVTLLPIAAIIMPHNWFGLTKARILAGNKCNPTEVAVRNAGDTRTQEEMLKKVKVLADEADYSALKTQVLPRAQRLCLATTSAAVRHAALNALTALAPRFDKDVAASMVNTLSQVRLFTKPFSRCITYV